MLRIVHGWHMGRISAETGGQQSTYKKICVPYVGETDIQSHCLESTIESARTHFIYTYDISTL